jgi:hypothetical protein
MICCGRAAAGSQPPLIRGDGLEHERANELPVDQAPLAVPRLRTGSVVSALASRQTQ